MLETAGLPVRFRRPLQENAPCSEKPVNISVLFPWREKGDGPTQQPRKRPRCCGRESRRSAPRKAPPNLTGRNSSPRKNGRGRLAQLVEYRSYTPTVRGSSPLPPTRNACKVPAVQRSAGTFLFGDTSGRLTNIPSPTGDAPHVFESGRSAHPAHEMRRGKRPGLLARIIEGFGSAESGTDHPS